MFRKTSRFPSSSTPVVFLLHTHSVRLRAWEEDERDNAGSPSSRENSPSSAPSSFFFSLFSTFCRHRLLLLLLISLCARVLCARKRKKKKRKREKGANKRRITLGVILSLLPLWPVVRLLAAYNLQPDCRDGCCLQAQFKKRKDDDVCRHPPYLIHLQAFQKRNIWTGVLCCICRSGCFFVSNFFILQKGSWNELTEVPKWVTTVRGDYIGILKELIFFQTAAAQRVNNLHHANKKPTVIQTAKFNKVKREKGGNKRNRCRKKDATGRFWIEK